MHWGGRVGPGPAREREGRLQKGGPREREGKLLPDFAPGMSFEPSVLALRESSTCAPPLLSESDLIALMDTNGIGTDATIAEHIETIQTRKYAPPTHMHETHVCDLCLG